MIFRCILFSSLFLLLNSCSIEDQSDPLELTLPIPKSYTIQKINSEIQIDGIASEEVWDNAEWSDYFIDIEGDKNPLPYYDTRVKMLWDDEFIYFYTEMEEEHIWGNLTERDAVIFYNNDFEIFIKPNEIQPTYAEFEVNALGTLWDLLLVRPYRRNGPVFDEWDVNNTKIGIHFNGTLNDPSDIDESWSLEMAIPIKPIMAIDRGSSLDHGDYWRINFSRVQWQHDIENGIYDRKKDSAGNYLRENNWVWTEQSAIAMHRPEHWGYLYFSDDKNNQISLVSPEEQVQYQFLFYLYRMQLDYFNENKTFGNIDDLFDTQTNSFRVNDFQFDAQFIFTTIGFEITVDGLNVNSITINQDGFITR